MEAPRPLDRQTLAAWYVRNRERSGRLFDAVRPEAYEARPIALRNPICFYEGHLPAFTVNTLLKRGLGEPGLDSDFELLFERGIDPESEDALPAAASLWPPRAATLGAPPEEGFVWDNERPRHAVDVAAFSIDAHSVTNRDFLEFVEGGGYEDSSLWSEEGWRWVGDGGARHPLFWELHRGT